MELFVFSDGGGDRHTSAAASCIIRSIYHNRERRIIVFLGPGTNNEGEICGILFALLVIKLIFPKIGLESPARIYWQSDSQYALKGLTQYICNWRTNAWKAANKKPVKNLSLWKISDFLVEDVEIIPEHVPAHSGHEENELCDAACSWARKNADNLLNAMPFCEVEVGGGKWLLIDAREFIRSSREAEDFIPENEFFCKISDLLSRGLKCTSSHPMQGGRDESRKKRANYLISELLEILTGDGFFEERKVLESLYTKIEKD